MADDMATTQTFHWADYLVLGVFLAFNTFLGLFIGWLDRHNKTSKSFLLGGGDMHYIPVALSMQASFLSAIFILTTPTEIYNFGTMYSYLAVSYFIALPIAAHMYLPTFHKLKLTSAYEYLERRFNRPVRLAGALTFAVMVILYMSVVLYTPAIALAQVTGLSVALSISVCGIVCVIYTVVGGMKATIWNDFIQMIIILLSLILLIVLGSLKVDGNFWDICVNGSRIEFDNFDPDPTVRTTFWTQVIGGTFVSLALYASSQTIIQKFLSVKKLKNAKKSIWVAAVTSTIFLVLVVLLGLVMYGYYAHCDPILSGRVEKSDQMVPLFVMDVMGDLHGLPGLFLAATFSAALSSISGSLNALAAVSLVDFIGPAYKRYKDSYISERASNILTRCIALGFGVLTIVLGFCAQFFGDLILQIALSIFGFVGGPLTALISLGLFFPFINSWGAMTGLIASLGMTSWVAIGSMVIGVPVVLLPRQSDGCPVSNSTTTAVTYSSDYYTTLAFSPTTGTPADDGSDILWIYKISYMYYAAIAMIVAIVVAIPVSLITGRAKHTDERLTFQWGEKCCCYCPMSCRNCLRCGSKHYDSDDDDDDSESHVVKAAIDDIGVFDNETHFYHKTSDVDLKTKDSSDNGSYDLRHPGSGIADDKSDSDRSTHIELPAKDYYESQF